MKHRHDSYRAQPSGKETVLARFTRYVLDVATDLYPKLDWKIVYEIGVDSIELWGEGEKVVSWAAWFIEEHKYLGWQVILTTLQNDMHRMEKFVKLNRARVRADLDERTRAWLDHYGILAEMTL